MNPCFMKEIFYLSPHSTHKKHNLFVESRKTTKYGTHSLKAFGAHIWNNLPEKIKKVTSLHALKIFLKDWYGPKCKCRLCQ